MRRSSGKTASGCTWPAAVPGPGSRDQSPAACRAHPARPNRRACSSGSQHGGRSPARVRSRVARVAGVHVIPVPNHPTFGRPRRAEASVGTSRCSPRSAPSRACSCRSWCPRPPPFPAGRSARLEQPAPGGPDPADPIVAAIIRAQARRAAARAGLWRQDHEDLAQDLTVRLIEALGVFDPGGGDRRLRSLLMATFGSKPQILASRTSRPPVLPVKKSGSVRLLMTGLPGALRRRAGLERSRCRRLCRGG